MIYDWDSSLAPKGIAFNRRGMSIGGPPGLGGRNQVAQIDAGYWIASLQQLAVGGPAAVKAFRRQMALLEGGAHQILVPVFDYSQAPFPDGVTSWPPSATIYTDGTRFSDGTGYLDRLIDIVVAATAALRATRLTLTVNDADDIVGGEYFEIGLGRLHMITGIISEASPEITVSIWPPLRERVEAGATLNFDNPKCRMRLLNEGDDDIALQMGRYGFPDIQFIEAFDTPTDTAEEVGDMCVRSQETITVTSSPWTLYADAKDEVLINNTTGGAITLQLFASARRRKPIRLVDRGYNAATYNWTILPASGETIMGGASYLLDSNGASIELSPLPDGTGLT